MELRVIGSSSAGNAYVLESEREILLVECGLRWKTILSGLNYGVGRCVGCLVSHEHGDHSMAVRDVMKNQIPVFTSAGTADALKVADEPMVHVMKEFEMTKIGEFDVMPFGVQHDAAEPFGYLIRHRECGTILFATDTYYLKYTFAGINHMMIECNYSQSRLDENFRNGIIPEFRRNRTMRAHLSLETLLGIIDANDMSAVREILLIHLSADNSDTDTFVKTIQEAAGKRTIIARPKLTMKLNINPF